MTVKSADPSQSLYGNRDSSKKPKFQCFTIDPTQDTDVQSNQAKECSPVKPMQNKLNAYTHAPLIKGIS